MTHTRAEIGTEIELHSASALAQLQLQRLQWTVRHAYENVPTYRRKFDEHGVHPDEIRTLDDVQRLPFTTKADLRESYPFGMFAVPMADVRRIHASSGTTGRPVSYTHLTLPTKA